MNSPTNEKLTDRVQQRSLRRFPENNSTTNTNNNDTIKSDIQHHHSWNHRDHESDRKIQSLLSSSLMNSSNTRAYDSDTSTNTLLPKRITHISPANTPGEDVSANHLNNYMSSITKTVPKVPKTSIPKESDSPSANTSAVDPAQSNENFLKTVLQNGEYLLKFNSWHQFRGVEEIKKCSKKVIERNENVWELVAIDYSHLKLLVNAREVYCKAYPYLETGSNQSTSVRSSSNPISEPRERLNNLFESIDSLLPGIDQLIECHAKICDCLISNHVIRPDRVITEMGRVLHESIPDDFIPLLAELYGRINYTKQYINKKLPLFRKYPVFESYIQKCERDPRCEKKTLADILLYISIHWSKKVTTLNSVIINTINDSHDLHNLMKFKEKVDKIVNEASNVMEDQMNSKLLTSLVANYEVTADLEDSERVLKYMTSENAKLIYSGKVQFESKRSGNGKQLNREVHGVALEDCIFFLQMLNEPGKSSPKYQLFNERDFAFPALLEWGKLYGYFREADSKISSAFSFYVIIEKPSPSIKLFFVDTPLERNYWKKCMMQGFSRWQSETSDIKEADIQLKEDLRKINKKWDNTRFGIDLIKNLDDSLRVQLEYRTVGFRCILEEELKRLTIGNGLVKRNSSNSVATVTDGDFKKDEPDSACIETFLPDLSTREGIHDWLEVFMEWVNRLKFSLCSSGANITRSASEIEARKRPSISTVKKCDTFSSRDSPTYEKRQTDVTFLNPPITKQKKDQRRISVSGFTNLFRINSKTVRHDETDKANDVASVTDTTTDADKDNVTISNLEMISEADCFWSGLSRDTVAAFNEVNIAAKNITIELINLRTQNMILEAEVKRIQEENQSFREFLRKYQKSVGDDQSGIALGNYGHQRTDSINNSVGAMGSSTLGGADIIAEGVECFTENPTGFTHTNQKMAECRRQTEQLREKYETFAKEKKAWEKEHEAQRRKMANDNENFFQKNYELQKEKDNLIEREKKYRDNCLNLQKKIDMYFEGYGINLEDEQIQPHAEGSICHNAKIQQMQQMQPHSRSHSDDVSHKHNSRQSAVSSSPVSPPLASTEAASYSCDNNNADQTHNSTIPDQLKGSLINQERQTLKTNSSDNILETKSKVTSSSMPKPKLTPSVDRKEMYSSNNTCFTQDEKEYRACSSDVDEFHAPACASVRTRNYDSVQTMRTTVNSEHSKPTVSHTSSDLSITKPSGLGLPMELAAKSKVKKEKSKKK